MPKSQKIHLMVNANGRYGWSACGHLLKVESAYDEHDSSRNTVTCKTCVAIVRRKEAQAARSGALQEGR